LIQKSVETSPRLGLTAEQPPWLGQYWVGRRCGMFPEDGLMVGFNWNSARFAFQGYSGAMTQPRRSLGQMPNIGWRWLETGRCSNDLKRQWQRVKLAQLSQHSLWARCSALPHRSRIGDSAEAPKRDIGTATSDAVVADGHGRWTTHQAGGQSERRARHTLVGGHCVKR
jgi:hypothetical protein